MPYVLLFLDFFSFFGSKSVWNVRDFTWFHVDLLQITVYSHCAYWHRSHAALHVLLPVFCKATYGHPGPSTEISSNCMSLDILRGATRRRENMQTPLTWSADWIQPDGKIRHFTTELLNSIKVWPEKWPWTWFSTSEAPSHLKMYFAKLKFTAVLQPDPSCNQGQCSETHNLAQGA